MSTACSIAKSSREPLKVNVFQAAMTSNTALMPLFPYLGPDSIVPCFGGADASEEGPRRGKFWHENSVDEVGIFMGSAGAMVFCAGRTHPVGNFDDEPPMTMGDGMAMAGTIVQRHPGPMQHESVTFRCSRCKRMLLRHRFEFDPATAENGELDALPSIVEAAVAAEQFNSSEEARTCAKCGHVNDRFPVEDWGWQNYRAQSPAAEAGRQGLVNAAEEYELNERRGTSA